MVRKPGDVECDRVLVREIEKTFEVVDDREFDRSALFGQLEAIDERWETLAGVLLHEPWLGDALRKSLQGQRPVDQVGEQSLGDGLVVANDLAFGHPAIGEEDLFGVRYGGQNLDSSTYHQPRWQRNHWRTRTDFGSNAWILEDMRERWLDDPLSVVETWQVLFQRRAGQPLPNRLRRQHESGARPRPKLVRRSNGRCAGRG